MEKALNGPFYALYFSLSKFSNAKSYRPARPNYYLLRSVWLHLVDKMAGQLARLIAVLDRNCGLELLRPQLPAWIPQLFVRLLHHLEVDSPPTGSATFK